MSAIFGFTFNMGRMTEVLTPDIYRAHCELLASAESSRPGFKIRIVPCMNVYRLLFQCQTTFHRFSYNRLHFQP